MDKHVKRRKAGRLMPYFLLALAIIIAHRVVSEIGFFLESFRGAIGVISPFFYGFLVAYIVNMPVGGIQRLLVKTKVGFLARWKKPISILLVLIIFVVIMLLVLNLIVPAIHSSVMQFIANFPVHYENAVGLLARIDNLELPGVNLGLDWIMETAWELLAQFDIEDLLSPINALLGVGSAIFSVFLAFISSIYILIEKEKFKAFIRRLLGVLVSPKTAELTFYYTGKLNKNFKQYIYTQTLDGLILGSIVTIQLYIMGSPYFLLLGILLGVLNYIPYFGSIVATIIAIVTVIFTQGIAMGLIAAAVLFITQQIDGNIIQPKLMGESFALPPLLVIIGITIGGAVSGILGMIVAIPIMAVLKDMLEDILSHLEREKVKALPRASSPEADE